LIARLLDRADAGYDPFFCDPAAVEDDYRRLAMSRWPGSASPPACRRSPVSRGARPAARTARTRPPACTRESVTADSGSSI